MAKKSKQRSKKDKITGLSMEFADLKTIVASDKIYGLESPLVAEGTRNYESYSGKDIVESKVEYEFNSNFIVETSWSRTAQPDSDGNYESLTRVVLQGDFTYNKGRLTSGIITSVAQNWPDGGGLGGVIYSSNAGGAKISDVKSWYSQRYAMSVVATEENKVVQYLDYDQDGSNDDEVLGLGEQAIREFGGGRFFYENWWDNPFASNLI